MTKTHYEYEVSVITKSLSGRECNTLTRTLAGEEIFPLNNNKSLCEVFLYATQHSGQHYALSRADERCFI